MKISRDKLEELKSALLIKGDSNVELQKMDPNIFDSSIIDPPYGICFMNKEWDNFSPEAIAKKTANHKKIDIKKQSARPASMHAGNYNLTLRGARGYQDWCYGWAVEVLRVTKPGGHILASCSTRMSHRLVTALEEAGWQIRDTLAWMYGTGFPKSTNVALGIDKLMGCSNRGHRIEYWHKLTGKVRNDGDAPDKYHARTPQAEGWDGFETALKPTMELICLARKPLSETSIAKNILRWGTGGLNIDGCRVTNSFDDKKRWPANVIMDEQAGNILDAQSKSLPSRFFYCPKPSNAEKNAGLESMPKVRRDTRDDKAAGVMSKKGVQPQQNSHPTIKPVDLMRYLCRLATPPNGVVLDCFMGSGTCGIAAYAEGFKYVGIELQEEYFEIAKKRIQHAVSKREVA